MQIFCLGERGEPRRCRAAGRDRSSGCTVGQPGGKPTAIKGKFCISIRNLQAAGKFTLVQLPARSCKEPPRPGQELAQAPLPQGEQPPLPCTHRCCTHAGTGAGSPSAPSTSSHISRSRSSPTPEHPDKDSPPHRAKDGGKASLPPKLGLTPVAEGPPATPPRPHRSPPAHRGRLSISCVNTRSALPGGIKEHSHYAAAAEKPSFLGQKKTSNSK